MWSPEPRAWRIMVNSSSFFEGVRHQKWIWKFGSSGGDKAANREKFGALERCGIFVSGCQGILWGILPDNSRPIKRGCDLY